MAPAVRHLRVSDADKLHIARTMLVNVILVPHIMDDSKETFDFLLDFASNARAEIGGLEIDDTFKDFRKEVVEISSGIITMADPKPDAVESLSGDRKLMRQLLDGQGQ